MRTMPAGVRALLGSGQFRFTSRCELIDQNGVFQNMNAYLGANWFQGATWTENVDQGVSTGSVTLIREHEGVSLAPAMGGSPANHVGGGYSPFLREGRGVRLSIAVTARGVAPSNSDFVEVFTGTYDNVAMNSATNDITLNIRDKGALIVDTFVRAKKTYAADTDFPDGVLLETVIQEILTDALGPGVATLYVPVGTGTKVQNVEIDIQSCMEAIRSVALMIGWDVRYRYDSAGVSRLTLSKPARESTGGSEQTWFPANEYIAIPKLDTSVTDVRNVIRVDFTNADTGLADYVEVSDPDSITAYRARWMNLSFSKTSTINTPSEATTLANSALWDLSYPFSDHDVELFPVFWAAQLGDYYGFRANGVVYDEDQRFGIFGFTHTLTNGSGSTTLVTKGRVVGAFREWQRRSDSEQGIQSSDTVDDRTLALKNFREIKRSPTEVTYGWDPVGTDVAEIWAWSKLSPQDDPDTSGATPGEDRLWRDTKTDTPDKVLDKTTVEFAVKIPDFGFIQTWELLPVDAKYTRGFSQRIKVLSVPDIPRITNLQTEGGASGLFKDITGLNVVDPQALGGRLRVWLNHDGVEDADPTSAPDGSITCDITPHTFTADDVFTVPGGTAQLFDNVRVHPGKGKHIYFEFVNSRQISSGVVGFVLLSNGGIIDADGNLLDDSINRASQVAAAFTLPSVYDALPGTGRENELAFLTTDSKMYRWTGTTWTATVPTADLSGVLTGDQIGNGILTTAKFAASVAPPEVLSSLPASPGPNRLAVLTTTGVLYRSKPDGSGWTAEATQIAAGAVTAGTVAAGAIGTTELAAGAITSAKIGAGQIQTLHMSAGSIDANVLTVRTINGDRLIAFTISANELAGNSVVAGKIAAAAVTATAISSGAVTAVKMSVTLLSEITNNAGIIVAGKLQSIDGTRYLDLNATGSNPFLQHPSLALRSDGSATFSGIVGASQFTAGTLSLTGSDAQIVFATTTATGIAGLRWQRGFSFSSSIFSDGIVIALQASSINLGSGTATISVNGHSLTWGPTDSGGTGYRALVTNNF